MRLEPTKFHFNRPLLSETIPLTIFGQFVEEMDTYEPTALDNKQVRELRGVMLQAYTDERVYCEQFRRALYSHYPEIRLMPSEIGSTKFISDRLLNEGDFMYYVCEGNPWGGNGDPEVQADGYHIASLRHRFNKAGDYPDRFPCMVIYTVGDYSDQAPPLCY